ncbi:putative translation initiation factor [Ascodesmis nigricans]|uniref:Methylthioribose-1-phosphate isomerase n=1 Tax=Ascodesmis nigricans TaxID=341454 RepID=A0A4S2MZ13_9PEZI|nr:putative translation initiation factor [Ascodesmis nigricans]
MSLEAIRYTRGSLTVLDQLLLPHTSVYVPIQTSADAFDAIRRMVVRGAPAIAIVAALALAVEIHSSAALPETATAAEVSRFVETKLDYLVGSRPTAVNLADAVYKLKNIVRRAVEEGKEGRDVRETYLVAAEKMLVDDVQDNRNIGDFGAEWIIREVAPEKKEKGGVRVLTHCNTGSLATAGYGTALGIIRSLYTKQSLTHAYCTETRPYNQGSRLTAYELAHDLPASMATLITDSMAASLLQRYPIAAIIVGADRVARNGDTANKIGTYQLAIVARHHGVKFIVAAPTTSVDMNTLRGEDIVIEERPANEVLVVRGPVVKSPNALQELDPENTATVAPGITTGVAVYNPSFDVTPKDLIDAIVTEKGVATKDAEGEFRLERFF